MYAVKYTGCVREDYRNMPPEIKADAKEALKKLGENPFSGKPLKKELAGYHSIRFRRYRIVYKIDTTQKTATVHAMGHRSTIYERMHCCLTSS